MVESVILSKEPFPINLIRLNEEELARKKRKIQAKKKKNNKKKRKRNSDDKTNKKKKKLKPFEWKHELKKVRNAEGKKYQRKDFVEFLKCVGVELQKKTYVVFLNSSLTQTQTLEHRNINQVHALCMCTQTMIHEAQGPPEATS